MHSNVAAIKNHIAENAIFNERKMQIKEYVSL